MAALFAVTECAGGAAVERSPSADVHLAVDAAVVAAESACTCPAPGLDDNVCVLRSRRGEREIARCKKEQRPGVEVDLWSVKGYARHPHFLDTGLTGTIPVPRVRAPTDSPAARDAFGGYVAAKRPCLVEGAVNCWPAVAESRWSFERLESRLRNSLVAVAEDPDGRRVRVAYKYFSEYLKFQQDDSPLHLFESRFDDPRLQEILEDFDVPAFLPIDLLGLVNRYSRPSYRWFGVGPRRSGLSLCTASYGKAMWTGVTHGRRRWVLFQPGTQIESLLARKPEHGLNPRLATLEPTTFFHEALPRIRADSPDVPIWEVVQGPGDLLFVPGNWCVAAVNLEDTVCVMQTFCGLDDFDAVWRRIRRNRRKFSSLWFRNLRKFAPPLYRRAEYLNRVDDVKMEFRLSRLSHSGSSSSSRSSSSESSSSSSPPSSRDSSSDLSHDLDDCLRDAVPLDFETIASPVVLGAAASSAARAVEEEAVAAASAVRSSEVRITLNEETDPLLVRSASACAGSSCERPSEAALAQVAGTSSSGSSSVTATVPTARRDSSAPARARPSSRFGMFSSLKAVGTAAKGLGDAAIAARDRADVAVGLTTLFVAVGWRTASIHGMVGDDSV
eukprot:TRINITY_DN34612_c0_g2_i1.p1 TRINITY_DN34612_c0_g2~~TRINITY_DN34612_c0_g2_i1.p1  ORF type:complete len:614 (+),score=67.03 TRINITY_DN34612_c0_g2_i1:152-1993(+)